MNSYKFNSTASYTIRLAISDCLKISSEEVYRSVKEFKNGKIVLKDGRVLVLKVLDNERV